MKYQCDKGHVFLHPAVVTVNEYTNGSLHRSVELRACVYCEPINYNLSEAPQDIVSVKTVDNNEADIWIAQGYEVVDINAKTTNLVKRKVK